jgi:hypothetical protein
MQSSLIEVPEFDITFPITLPDSVVAYRVDIKSNEPGRRSFTISLKQLTSKEIAQSRSALAASIGAAGFRPSRPGVFFENLRAFADADAIASINLMETDTGWKVVEDNALALASIYKAFTRAGDSLLMQNLARSGS